MQEKKLIRLLLALGVISLIAIAAVYFLMLNRLGRLVAAGVPDTLCAKDSEENFILAKPTSFEVCTIARDVDSIKEVNACGWYEGTRKVACEELTKIAEGRVTDCVSLVFRPTRTTVDADAVEQHCATLGVIRELPELKVTEPAAAPVDLTID